MREDLYQKLGPARLPLRVELLEGTFMAHKILFSEIIITSIYDSSPVHQLSKYLDSSLEFLGMSSPCAVALPAPAQ